MVICGAGFGGLSAISRLTRAGMRVTLVDGHLYSTFQPLLYQVATGGLNPGDIAYPVGGFTGHGRPATSAATSPRSTRRRGIKLAGGRELGYDYLILATGVSANYFGVKGAAENTFGLYTRADAIVLRDHIMNGFDWLDEDPDGRREFTVTVVGGGATGVELAGTLGELRNDVLRATFPDVDPERVHIRLVEMAPALLMPFHPKLRAYTRKQLVERGVDIRLNTHIREVTPDQVILGDDGQSLHSDLTVWTGGVAAPEPAAAWGFRRARTAASSSDLTCGSRAATGSSRPATSRSSRTIRRRSSRSPRCRRAGTSPGRSSGCCAASRPSRSTTTTRAPWRRSAVSSAVVQLPRGLRITGTLAWFAWLGLHLFYLLGDRNRVATLINLSWRYIAWGHGGGVIVGDEPMVPLPGGTTSA